MQRKHYHQFEDEQQNQNQQQPPRGIPVGQPIQQGNPYQIPPFQGIQQNVPQPQMHQGYVPQHQGYHPQMNNVNQQQPIIMMAPPPPPMMMNPMIQNKKAYDNPIIINCPCCRQTVSTVVNQESGNTTWLWALGIFCCCGPWCCVPFMMDSCMDKNHYCPHCGHNILRKHQQCFDFIGC